MKEHAEPSSRDEGPITWGLTESVFLSIFPCCCEKPTEHPQMQRYFTRKKGLWVMPWDERLGL